MKILKMSKEERSEIISMFIPTFAEQFFFAFVGMFITAVIKESGMEAVAAVTLLNALVALFQQFFTSVGVGVMVSVAQLRGRGDPKVTGNTASQALTLSFIISIVVTALFYAFMEPLMFVIFRDSEPLVYEFGRIYLIYDILSLPLVALHSTASSAIRGSGYPRISLIITLIYNGLYVAMGYTSVHWLNFGLHGISASLVLSRLFAAVAAIYFLQKGNKYMAPTKIKLKIERSVSRPIFRVAIPLLLESLIFSGGRLITQTFSVGYGTNSIAANGIAFTIHGFQLFPGMSMTGIAAPIVGRYCGKGDLEGAKRKGTQILVLTFFIATITCVLLFIFLKPLIATMTDVPEVAAEVYKVAVSYCIMLPLFWTIGFGAPSILRSSGDGKFTSAVCITAMVVMRITTGYLLTIVFKVGIIGIWISMYLDWLVRDAFFLPRFKSGKWLQFKVLD